MKKLIILIIILSIFMLSGCGRSIDSERYEKVLGICYSKTPDQLKYCQCYASCEVETNRQMNFPPDGYYDCHTWCREEWRGE